MLCYVYAAKSSSAHTTPSHTSKNNINFKLNKLSGGFFFRIGYNMNDGDITADTKRAG